MADKTRLSLDLIGYNDVMRALKQSDEVAYKAIRKKIREVADIVAQDARGKVTTALPKARNWRGEWPQKFPPWNRRKLTRGDKGWPAFNVNDMRESIKVSFRRTRFDKRNPRLVRSSVSVESRSAALTIYEFARFSHASKQFPYVNSVPFLNAMGRATGGRVVWKAYEENIGVVRDKLMEIAKELESVTQRAIDNAKDGG